jgi:hypothetical protein
MNPKLLTNKQGFWPFLEAALLWGIEVGATMTTGTMTRVCN